jgi:hypothetical protein
VVGVREEVECAKSLEFVATLDERLQVASESDWVAGHIHNVLWLDF